MSFELHNVTGGPEDKYIHEVTDKDDDGENRLSVARVLSGSKARARELVRRANAFDDLLELAHKVWEHDDDVPDHLFFLADDLIHQYDHDVGQNE
jgi:hypothetical protein